MAKSKKEKVVTVFNTGERTYTDVHTTADGKHLDLEPGKSLDLPASVAAFLINGYPREIVGARPTNAGEAKELDGREAAVERREVKAAEREQEIGESGEELEKQRAVVSERVKELDARELEVTAREEKITEAAPAEETETPNAE